MKKNYFKENNNKYYLNRRNRLIREREEEENYSKRGHREVSPDNGNDPRID